MKKIILCICLGVSLFASDINFCDTKYLKPADEARLELEKVLVHDSPFSSNDKITIFLKYIELMQDRYLICKQYDTYEGRKL